MTITSIGPLIKPRRLNSNRLWPRGGPAFGPALVRDGKSTPEHSSPSSMQSFHRSPTFRCPQRRRWRPIGEDFQRSGGPIRRRATGSIPQRRGLGPVHRPESRPRFKPTRY